MVRFRCRRSGNYVCFSRDEDIAQMRKHEGYDEVTDTNAIPDPVQIQQPVKRGRPRKVVAEEV